MGPVILLPRHHCCHFVILPCCCCHYYGRYGGSGSDYDILGIVLGVNLSSEPLVHAMGAWAVVGCEGLVLENCVD